MNSSPASTSLRTNMRQYGSGKLVRSSGRLNAPSRQNHAAQPMDGATSSLPHLRERDREGAHKKIHGCKLTPSPALPASGGGSRPSLPPALTAFEEKTWARQPGATATKDRIPAGRPNRSYGFRY